MMNPFKDFREMPENARTIDKVRFSEKELL